MLPENDDEFLRRTMAHYQPQMPHALATRIIARATAEPQKLGLFGTLNRAFSEWDYALNMKGAALAAFAALGLLSAQLNSQDAPGLDVRSVLMADPNWTEEL